MSYESRQSAKSVLYELLSVLESSDKEAALEELIRLQQARMDQDDVKVVLQLFSEGRNKS